MSETFDTKPEPITAKPNWHYDTYFLSQLERLNLRKPIHETPNQESKQVGDGDSESKVLKKKTTDNDSPQTEAQINKSDEVINCINQLAASIGVVVRIIGSSKEDQSPGE
jgi:hypothetical protein